MNEFPISQVMVQDAFWSPRLESTNLRAIYHQYEMLETSGCIDNFRILTGEKEGFREGWFFADSDAYKWLDAAVRIYARQPEARLAGLIDSLIALLGRAQSADGYIFTYNQIHFPSVRWVNLQIEHELYCHGHLIEAAVSHAQATVQVQLLDIGRKAADLIVHDFLGAGPERTPGHEEIEIALLRLYGVTAHHPYLEMARQFIEQRGRNRLFAATIYFQNSSSQARTKQVQKERLAYAAHHPAYAVSRVPPGNYAKPIPNGELRRLVSALSGQYLQQHAPIRRQTKPVGHAVRFGYFQTAAAMLNRLQPDAELIQSMERAWEHMVVRRMYVTGGLGAQPSIEGFGNDYELDAEYAYNETCAALACQLWSWQLALTTGKARYSDLFEWQMYNASAVGMGLDGETYLYNNPLACRSGITRKSWYAVPCCPSNLSRAWADLGKYLFSQIEKNIWVHQYVGATAKLNLAAPIEIRIESGFPWHGNVRLSITAPRPEEFTLHLRLPSWRQAQPKIEIETGGLRQEMIATADSEPAPALPEPAAQGYDPRSSRFLSIYRLWMPGDVVRIKFDLPVRLLRCVPQVKNHAGLVALSRGPLVYCLESVDNPGVDIFNVQLDPGSLHSENQPGLLEGITILRGSSMDGKELTFIPYTLWANRGASQMTVWVHA